MSRLQYNSPVILTYALISLAAVCICSWTGLGYALFSVYKTSLLDPLFYLRLFTHVLGHQDFSHYFSNFLVILLIGPMLEEKYGSKRLLLLMVITALITGIIFVTVSPSGHALLGASGILFMLMLLCSFANFKKGRIPVTLILILVLYIGREIVQGVTTSDNVSNMTHIAGGLLGAALGFIFNNEGMKSIGDN